jgi:hypothetical protein
MADEGATAAIAAAVTAALDGVAGLSGVFDGAPMRAGDAHAVVEIGPESDWGHKSGAGAEVRLAVLIRCGGERHGRARALSYAARAAVEAIGPQLGPWRLVSLAMLRSRVVAARDGGRSGQGPGWTGVVEYRARMLRTEDGAPA